MAGDAEPDEQGLADKYLNYRQHWYYRRAGSCRWNDVRYDFANSAMVSVKGRGLRPGGRQPSQHMARRSTKPDDEGFCVE